MKSFLVSIAIVIAVTGVSVWNASCVNRHTAALLFSIAALPESEEAFRNHSETEKAITSAQALWDKQSHFLSITVSYPWIAAVQIELTRCAESFHADSYEDYLNARAALTEAITYIRQREGFSVANII